LRKKRRRRGFGRCRKGFVLCCENGDRKRVRRSALRLGDWVEGEKKDATDL